jgi:hypothetical protein
VQTLAESRGEHIDVFLDWIIVPGAPGSWAKNAVWDEYLLRVDNHHDDTVTIMWVRAFDSKDTELRPNKDRRLLIKQSRQSAKRYKEDGVRVTPGAGSAAEGLLLTGGIAGMAAPAMALGAISSGSTVAAGGALALVAAAPILLVGGVVVAVNNDKVEEELARRHSTLPRYLGPGQADNLDLFFPLVPSPQRVDLYYFLDGVGYTVSVDLAGSLDGLHIEK